MVTKKKKGSTEKRGKVKVDKLKLSKETVKDLTDSEAGQVRGGVAVQSCPELCGGRGKIAR